MSKKNQESASAFVSKRAFLERIARMYYIMGFNQEEIAKQMDIGRSSVARFLNEARSEGVIQFTIASDFENWRDQELEKDLIQRSELKECVVFQSSIESGYSFEALASMYLNTLLPMTGSIGLGWGRTVYAVGQHMHLCEPRPNVSVVQLTGGAGAKEDLVPATSAVQLWSNALKSKPIFLPAPAVVESPEMKASFLNNPSIKEVLEQVGKVNVAIVGIGNTGPDATIYLSNIVRDENPYLLSEECVGDIMFHFYDSDGKFCLPELSGRIVGATIEDFMNADLRIAIAKGSDKMEAIAGAIKGRLIQVLITTEDTAASLLRSAGGLPPAAGTGA